MKLNNIAGKKNISEFVSWKLKGFSESEKNMRSLYEFMFTEQDNVFAEETDGYKIKKTTYGTCQKNIELKSVRISALLSDVALGSVVGIDLKNSIEWIEIFWAILKSGFKPLLINDRIGKETLENTFEKFGVKAIVASEKKYSVTTLTLQEINEYPLPEQRTAPEFANEIFLMSSNTSGNLKICGYTGEQFYYQICDSAKIIQESTGIRTHYEGELKLLTFLPFYHVFGLVAVYIWFAFFSRTLVFLKDNDPKNIVPTIKKHRVTHVFSVPLFWETIYKTAINTIKSRGDKTYNKFVKGLKTYRSLSKNKTLASAFSKIAFKEVRENIFGDSIRFMISGGGGISSDVLLFFNAIGYHLANGYGATETGITSVELSEKPNVLISGSVGKPFQSLEYKLNDKSELLVKSKSMAHSIYIDGKKVETEEWFNTHDLVSVKKGRYFIGGRMDDLIICGHGENVNPNFIEPKLKVAGMQNLCLFASQEQNNIYALLLVEVASYLGSKQLNDVYNAIKDVIQKDGLSYAVQRIVFTSTPLLDENEFKLNRKKIRNKYLNGEMTILSLDKQEPEEYVDPNLLEQVTTIFASALNKDTSEITRDAHFFYDLGGSSLDYFTMITGVQNKFGIPFPVLEQNSLATVNQICEYIKENTIIQ